MRTLNPSQAWIDFIKSDKDSVEFLRDYISQNPPTTCELVVNPKCGYECKHCIYPPNYGELNDTMPLEQWSEALDHAKRLGMDTFIFGGRGLNPKILDIIDHLKTDPSNRVGFIVDGPQVKGKNLERVLETPADWIDVSLDGDRLSHDNIRRIDGSYETTLKFLELLVRKGRCRQINVLLTLTSISRDSITETVRKLNGEYGILNFVVTPITIPHNSYLDPNLKVPNKDLGTFAQEFEEVSRELVDSYCHMNSYTTETAKTLLQTFPGEFSAHEGIVRRSRKFGENEFQIYINPLSLCLSNEFIVNSDGTIFAGATQGQGVIAQEHTFGNIKDLRNIKSRNELSQMLADGAGIEYYAQSLDEEREQLRELL